MALSDCSAEQLAESDSETERLREDSRDDVCDSTRERLAESDAETETLRELATSALSDCSAERLAETDSRTDKLLDVFLFSRLNDSEMESAVLFKPFVFRESVVLERLVSKECDALTV